MRLTAIILVAAAAAWRIASVHAPEWGNFSPLMALAFCGGVYFRDRWMWVVPFAALAASDLYLDRYYAMEFHYEWSIGGAAIRMLCFASGLALGRLIASRRSWFTLGAGTVGSAAFFYLVTNTASWLGDAGYAHDSAGWLQAMTVGHPQFASTLYFFRNTVASDLLFTALFALAMEYLSLRRGAESLLARRAPVKE